MADKKISALTSATTPLAGTEVLPIVQSSTTVKVAVNDLTVQNIRANATTGILQITGPAAASTRIATVPDANWTAARTDAAQSFTGNQTLSTGNLVVSNGKGIDFSATPGTGTSELFADYEEGTFTPTWTGGTFTSSVCTYTKVGRQVTCTFELVFGSSVTATTGYLSLPFAGINTYSAGGINYNDISTGLYVNVETTNTRFAFRSTANGASLTSLQLSGKTIYGFLTYFA
jgi:hypothetical protein